MKRYFRPAILIICDILAVHLAYILAFLLRFGFDVNSVQFDSWFTGYATHLLAITVLSLIAFFSCGLYRRSKNGVLWRFALKTLIATLLCQFLIFIFYRLTSDTIPRNVYFVSGVIIYLWCAVSRIAFKLWHYESLLDERSEKRIEKTGEIDTTRVPDGELSGLSSLYTIAEIRNFSRALQDALYGRVVLVAGAGSEVGKALTSEILRFAPRRLILCDTGEGVREIERLKQSLSGKPSKPDVVECILSLSDSEMLKSVLELYTPHYVFDTEEVRGGEAEGEKEKRLAEVFDKFAVQKWVGLRERGEEARLTAQLMLLRLPGVNDRRKTTPADNEEAETANHEETEAANHEETANGLDAGSANTAEPADEATKAVETKDEAEGEKQAEAL